jgi:signal transduction histidine kinase
VDLGAQLHVAAGVGALGLGVAVLVREPRRRRNRLFAALCGALVVWNLGVAASILELGGDLPWRLIFLLGSCAAAPIGLHFVLTVTGVEASWRRPVLLIAYLAAAGLWLSSLRFHNVQPRWNLVALTVLGVILAVAVTVLGRHAIGLPPSPERRAFRVVFGASVLAVIGGLSDFVPRGDLTIIKVGPVFMLAFLLVVCSVVMRHRFLDVDVFLARAVALMAGAVGATLVLLGTVRLFGARFIPLFITSLVLLSTMGPLVRRTFTRAREFLGGEEQIARAMVATSQELSHARSADEVWEAIEDGRRVLPGDVHLVVYLARDEGRFAPVYQAGVDAAPAEVDAGTGLPVMLAVERGPITRRYLEVEIDEGDPVSRGLAREALAHLETVTGEMVVPLLGEDRLVGWIAVGGGDSERYVRSQVAAAFMAVGNQALASLERINAQAEARRRETLAAVGEMAAGLAHEVRNPVAAIRGAAQAITPEATPEQSREMLEVIGEETERLGRVVGEFLDYARPSSPRRERVDAGDLARRVARAAELSGSGLEVQVDISPDAAPVTGDPDQLHRAFENLVRNAAEATGAGGTLRIDVTPGREGRTAISFADDGPGIPDEVIPNLFRPFHTTKTGGTGLGLALVHRIVESHGGSIRVDGRPGRGAVFTLELPR